MVVKVIPGINVDRWQTAVFAALVLGLINASLRPLVILFTLPLNILSLGLFTLVINGFLFYLVYKLVKGFTIHNFWDAFWGALLFSIISFFLNLFFNPQGKMSVHSYKYVPTRSPKYQEVINLEGEIEDKK